MTEMIQRVGRIIEFAIMRHGVEEIDLEGTIDDARAAIEAMRDPTKEMYLASLDDLVPYADASACWKAMIDAALGEPPTSKA